MWAGRCRLYAARTGIRTCRLAGIRCNAGSFSLVVFAHGFSIFKFLYSEREVLFRKPSQRDAEIEESSLAGCLS